MLESMDRAWKMAQTGTSESEDAYRAHHYFRFTLGANVARQVVNAFMKYLAGRKWTSAHDAGAMWESLMFGGEVFNFDAPVDPRAVEHPEDPMGDDRCGTLWLVKWLDESRDPSNTRVRRLRVVHSKRYGALVPPISLPFFFHLLLPFRLFLGYGLVSLPSPSRHHWAVKK